MPRSWPRRSATRDIFEIEGGRERYDYRRSGRERWIARINAIELAELTPDKVQEWKRSFLAKTGTSHSDQRTARISVNSLIRRAKSLFAAKAKAEWRSLERRRGALHGENGPCAGLDPVVFELMTMNAGTLKHRIRSVKHMG